VQATLFWLTGGAFFALQIGMLLYLLYASPTAGLAATGERRRRVEIVWTLVPASILVAVVLMVSGLTGSPWTRLRSATARDAAAVALHHPDVPLVHREAAR
jgi:heme/copper-type cytochrome/quinol oxidase subunit 2